MPCAIYIIALETQKYYKIHNQQKGEICASYNDGPWGQGTVNACSVTAAETSFFTPMKG